MCVFSLNSILKSICRNVFLPTPIHHPPTVSQNGFTFRKTSRQFAKIELWYVYFPAVLEVTTWGIFLILNIRKISQMGTSNVIGKYMYQISIFVAFFWKWNHSGSLSPLPPPPDPPTHLVHRTWGSCDRDSFFFLTQKKKSASNVFFFLKQYFFVLNQFVCFFLKQYFKIDVTPCAPPQQGRCAHLSS